MLTFNKAVKLEATNELSKKVEKMVKENKKPAEICMVLNISNSQFYRICSKLKHKSINIVQ